MSTITEDQQRAIAEYLRDRPIAEGLGDKDSACSIAAINLALSGELTDEIPACMSEVIGRWIIVVQDAMPPDMRNSAEWRDLLPLAAGTGRDLESERLAIIHTWMWDIVLPYSQPIAEAGGYGEAWKTMCQSRTESAALAAKSATSAAKLARSESAWSARLAAKSAAWSARSAAESAAESAESAAESAKSAAESAESAAESAAWKHFDPVALLARLIDAR